MQMVGNKNNKISTSCFLIFMGLIFCDMKAQVNSGELNNYIKTNATTPAEYIIEKFKTNDIILLGEHHMVKQNLLFIQQLIPILYENGVYSIGMEFGAYENQHKMDSLLMAEKYDENLAEAMMFDYNVTWAYKEYIDVTKVAWEFNSTLPKNAKKFRIINLSYIYRWDQFNGTRDVSTMKAVFSKGPVDKFRAQIIENEIINKQEKLLALVGTPHAYTKYGSPYFLYNADNFCDYDYNWLGNRLYNKYPDKVFNIILHQAFTEKNGEQYTLISPVNGIIEKLMLQNENKPVGFDLYNSPIGELADKSINSLCYDNFTLGQYFDGYIFLQPLNELESCTVVPDFVNAQNIHQAIEQFPDPDWHQKISNLQEMLDFIVANSKQPRL